MRERFFLPRSEEVLVDVGFAEEAIGVGLFTGAL